MISFLNENILGLIIKSYSLYICRKVPDIIKNQIICKVALRILKYKDIYTSMGKAKTFLNEHKLEIVSLALLPNSNIITYSNDKKFKIWNVNSNQCIRTFQKGKIFYKSLIVLPNGDIIACSNHDKIKVFVAKFDYSYVKTISINNEDLYEFGNLLSLPNGNIACSAYNGAECSILIIDYIKDDYLIVSGHTGAVACLVNLCDIVMASGSFDQTIKLWSIDETNSYQCFKTLMGHEGTVLALLYIWKDKQLISGSSDKTIKVWDLNDEYRCVKVITAHCGEVNVLLQLRCRFFASCSADRTLKIWDLNGFVCINTLEGHKGGISSLLSLVDNRIASASLRDNSIILWSY
jgi:WD40 repeat protein